MSTSTNHNFLLIFVLSIYSCNSWSVFSFFTIKPVISDTNSTSSIVSNISSAVQPCIFVLNSSSKVSKDHPTKHCHSIFVKWYISFFEVFMRSFSSATLSIRHALYSPPISTASSKKKSSIFSSPVNASQTSKWYQLLTHPNIVSTTYSVLGPVPSSIQTYTPPT